MSKREDELREYKKADANKRLHLYLQFRDLRGDFMEIERRESKYLRFSNPQFLKLFLHLTSCWAPRTYQTLEDGTKTCIWELTEEVDILPGLSHHIRELPKTGLVRIERQGKQIQCWMEPEVVQDLAEFFPRMKSFCAGKADDFFGGQVKNAVG